MINEEILLIQVDALFQMSVPRDNSLEMVHIILLMQFGDNARTRSWQDFTKINDAMKFICTKYEEFLKKKNPQQAYLTYNIIDLYAYIDSVGCFILF